MSSHFELKCEGALIEKMIAALISGEIVRESVVVHVDHGSATRRDRTSDVRFTVSGEARWRGCAIVFAVGCLDRVADVAREGCEPWALLDAEIHKKQTREAFLILSASMKAPPRWSWRPVGAKRSKVTGFGSRDEAIKSLQAAGYTLVERPEESSRVGTSTKLNEGLTRRRRQTQQALDLLISEMGSEDAWIMWRSVWIIESEEGSLVRVRLQAWSVLVHRDDLREVTT